MGYTTWFNGEVTVEPPLNAEEQSFLADFSNTRRMARHSGPYYCQDTANFGQNDSADVIDLNGNRPKTHEWVDNPNHTPHLQFGDPGYEPLKMKVELETPIVPPEYETPAAQPGLWCHWEPQDEGHMIGWDESEKFYDAFDWMVYLIDNFLKPGAFMTTEKGQELVKLANDPRLAHFTCNHVVNGVIHAEGEESGDVWRIVVKDNVAQYQEPTVTWPPLPEGLSL